MRQIGSDVGEKLFEQAQHAGKQLKQAPVTIFQKAVGERTDEEKKREKDESGVEPVTGGGGQQQPALSQTDLRRRELEMERQAHIKKMRKLLHNRLFTEAKKVRERKLEEERLRKMQEEEEKRKKEEKKMKEIEERKKEEDIALQMAKREKGAGELGPKAPK